MRHAKPPSLRYGAPWSCGQHSRTSWPRRRPCGVGLAAGKAGRFTYLTPRAHGTRRARSRPCNAGSRRSASWSAPLPRRYVSLPLGHYLLGVGVVAGFDIGVGAGLDIGVGAGVGADSTGLGEGEAPGEPSALGEGDGLAFAVLCFVRA